jgi:hypothetical protein
MPVRLFCQGKVFEEASRSILDFNNSGYPFWKSAIVHLHLKQ